MSKQAHELETQQHLLSLRKIQIVALGSRVAALDLRGLKALGTRLRAGAN